MCASWQRKSITLPRGKGVSAFTIKEPPSASSISKGARRGFRLERESDSPERHHFKNSKVMSCVLEATSDDLAPLHGLARALGYNAIVASLRGSQSRWMSSVSAIRRTCTCEAIVYFPGLFYINRLSLARRRDAQSRAL